MIKHAIITAILMAALSGSVQAAMLTVGQGAGYDFGSIQAAINASQNGDTVVVAAGTYIKSIYFNGKNIILTSTDPDKSQIVEDTVIEAPDDSRVVTFNGNENESCILNGFTVTEGRTRDQYGGGIWGGGTKATITNCIIEDNRAELGGAGIYDCDGLIRNCNIQDNHAEDQDYEGNGGGLYGCDGLIVNCTISDNTAGDDHKFAMGGGLYNCNGTISNCTIQYNNAYGDGGGLYGCNGLIEDCIISNNTAGDEDESGMGGGLANCNALICNCTITNNRAETLQAKGGGLYRCNGSITNCNISNNISNGFGGGLYEGNAIISNCIINNNSATGWDGGGLSQCITVNNCVISGNSASGNGGAIANCQSVRNCLITYNTADGDGGALADCSLTYNSTIYGNSASGNGGAIYCLSGCAALKNSILWENAAASGHQIYLDFYSNASPFTINYCNIQGSHQGAYVAAGRTVSWGPGNIDIDPQFISTQNNDFRLLPSSVCINACDPDYIAQSNETDLDGNPRISNGTIDMGVYEFQGIPSWHVDVIHGNDNNSGLSKNEALRTINQAINRASNGNIILVYPGVYSEQVSFSGKAITVQSAEDAAILQAPDDFAVSFYMGEGLDSVLKNFIIKNSYMGVFIAHSSPTISNVTVADNKYGIEAYGQAEPDISNCIFWNNSDSDLSGCEARYSFIQSQEPSNIEPLFVNPGSNDYHLRSKRGRYWPQYNIWVLDTTNSPCIDAGDPAVDFSGEPRPNGGRINIGAYGGTAYAGMSQWWPPGDVNQDGVVDMIDLAIICQFWLEGEQKGIRE